VFTRISLVALLSILMVSASVSASACDLSCWLRQIHSDCHGVSSAATSQDNTVMAMTEDMDMSSMDPDMAMSATSDQSMVMSPQHEMVMQPFEHATKPESGTGATRDHSKGMSSCTHEACNQFSISLSPPGGDHSPPISSTWLAVTISNPVNLGIGLPWLRLEVSPPKLLTADRLITTLRI
jgi:hypothetical protein